MGARGSSRMAGNPLLNRPLGAFEPVRRLSRPTDERPQEPRRDQKRKAHDPPEDSSPRNGCDRRVRPHPPPRRSGGPPGCLHPGGPAPIFATMPPHPRVLLTTQRQKTPRSRPHPFKGQPHGQAAPPPP